MKILTAIGARPQFIKAAPIGIALRIESIDEIVVHSGQHYDYRMSQVFFDELEIPPPEVNLGVGSGTHGVQTAGMLTGFERVMLEHKPDLVMVHGDTNSTIAAALAAVKLEIKVAHNEAGLRSFNRSMPEEHNRVLTDHCADFLFCPNEMAKEQLRREGVVDGVYTVGDVMFDACLKFARLAQEKSDILDKLKLKSGEFLLSTIHRPYNVDVPERLQSIFRAFKRSGKTIVLPGHPRLIFQMKEQKFNVPDCVRLIDPVGYLDMIMLEKNARMILTDSGGVQKEAYFFRVPCVTLRPETEWTETVESGWNRLVDTEETLIVEAIEACHTPDTHSDLFGDGRAAEKIVRIIQHVL